MSATASSGLLSLAAVLLSIALGMWVYARGDRRRWGGERERQRIMRRIETGLANASTMSVRVGFIVALFVASVIVQKGLWIANTADPAARWVGFAVEHPWRAVHVGARYASLGLDALLEREKPAANTVRGPHIAPWDDAYSWATDPDGRISHRGRLFRERDQCDDLRTMLPLLACPDGRPYVHIEPWASTYDYRADPELRLVRYWHGAPSFGDGPRSHTPRTHGPLPQKIQQVRPGPESDMETSRVWEAGGWRCFDLFLGQPLSACPDTRGWTYDGTLIRAYDNGRRK